MAHLVFSHCDCCGLAIDLTRAQVCPVCQYPVDPEKERAFLETSIRDLRRVVRYGGASITVTDLVRRYERRLHVLAGLETQGTPATPRADVPAASLLPSVPETHLLAVSAQPAAAASLSSALPALTDSIPPAGGGQTIPVQPAASMRGFSLSSDAMVNIIAALGGFLILAGALGFVLTTSSLWLSFGGIFLLQIVFGGAGLFAQRRFPLLRAVSTLYTLISALLVPLVGFSAYRLVTNGMVELSVPLLLMLAALYAAAIYSLLAVVQRFVPFAYLGVIALLVGDLALAQALHLAYWWWPCIALLLALVALLAVSRPSQPDRLFAEERAILRTPLLGLMYAIVVTVVLLAILLLGDSLFLEPLREERRALFSLSCLVLVWSALWIWRTGRVNLSPVLAYLLLGTLALLGYVLNLDRAGYVLLLACVALGYHALARVAGGRLSTRGLPTLALDQLAIGLSVLLMLLVAFAMPFQLLARASAQSSLLGPIGSLTFIPDAGISFELLALGMCFLTTLDIIVTRAGFAKTPARAAWCWLLLLSGSLLASIYGLEVLLWHVVPLWAFLTFSLALLACAILTRRLTGSSWANPLDVLALGEIVFTLLLSLGQASEVVSAFLLGFATVLYGVLLYQRRPLPSVLSSCLLLLALPFLQAHPMVVLGVGLLLPPVSAGMQLVGLFGNAPVSRLRLFAWTLLVPALVYGLVLATTDINSGQSVLANWSSLHLSMAYEIAALGLTWYAAALVAREKLWLVPATLFWLIALLLPSNNFWVLSALTPALAILAAGIGRRVSVVWALPFYLAALFSSGMVGYTGLLSQHLTALSWIYLGFALLAYGLGLLNDHEAALWLTPLYATLAIVVAAALLGDLYRPPFVAIVCAGLGVVVSRSSLPLHQRRPAVLRSGLPFYTTALAAAVLTGIYGVLGNINRPFYGAVPDVLLLDALVAFAVLRIERRPRWCWLVAVLAAWSVLLTQRLTPAYVLETGTGLALLGLLSWRLFPAGQKIDQGLQRLAWSWPWYTAFLVAALVLGSWPVVSGQPLMTGLIVLGILAFTALAALGMLIERAPEFVVFPAGLAAWTIHLWLPGANPVPLILAYTFLCALIFATQFTWRVLPAATRWLPETSLHNALSLGGLGLVLLGALSQGALSPGAGALAQAGVLALVTLSLLIFLYGLTHPATVARRLPQKSDELKRAERVEGVRVVRHWCSYSSGLLLTLAVSWELLAFHQTRFDVLTLVPASYLIVIAPFLLRDRALPEHHIVGQLVSLAGAALLLLPALWFSFNGRDLLPTLILLAESLALLALGLITRLRIFILSSAALVVVGTLRLLFLSIPQSVPILLMAFGSLLVLLATGLILARHRLQAAWKRWE